MYAVILFTKENSVEVVPQKWIVSGLDSTDSLCFWPPFKGTILSNAVADNMDVNLSWHAYTCQIVKGDIGKE